MTIHNVSGAACRLMPLVVIATMSLSACSSGNDEAAPVDVHSYAEQLAYANQVRANVKALYAVPEISLSQQVAIVTATCEVTAHIVDRPADVGTFDLVYCP